MVSIKNCARVCCAVLALAFGQTAVTTPAMAQQTADEPGLDPIFGKRPPKPEEQMGPMNDDEFDQPQGWSPLRGFVGVLTFLVPETTNLSLGVGPSYQPDYFGSDDYEFRPDPQVYIKVRNFLFLDDDGADLALIGFSGFAIGPSIRVAGRRREEDNVALQGLGDIGFTFEAGGFIATTFLDRMLVRAKVRKGVTGGHDGLVIDGAGTVLLFTTPRFSASLSGQVSWVDDSYADTFFSITPDQSAASGLPIYDADAGFRDSEHFNLRFLTAAEPICSLQADLQRFRRNADHRSVWDPRSVHRWLPPYARIPIRFPLV